MEFLSRGKVKFFNPASARVEQRMLKVMPHFLTHPGLKATLPCWVREGAGGWVRVNPASLVGEKPDRMVPVRLPVWRA